MTNWTPALSTGVPLIDEHHRIIFQWLVQHIATTDMAYVPYLKPHNRIRN